MFTKVLVANRGEIARRVMRTCRRLGIATVAVYSDADQDAPHVADADEAVRLGPAPATESYLDIELVIEAALVTGAEAIHPGYGFLSENAAFAEACKEAGITFIGPNVEAIRVMGDKGESKRLLEPAGVPMVPGIHTPGLTDEDLLAAADNVGFPALVKAVAGGGGKGMRTVQSKAELPDALAAARREATNAFGDDTLIMERYVTSSRHVEVQVFGDTHGNVIHLFERECSVQRRHQKVVEETPSPAVDDALRKEMGEAAVRAAKAVDYEGAGTVEFLLADTGEFFFLEMNTRLQVEHPITEAITGLDLVELQLRVAAGEELPVSQDQVTSTGHAVEVRLYAEDPAAGFLPQLGTVAVFDVPGDADVRLDTGVEDGSEVTRFYDPMLAKLIVHGPDRATSLARMAEVLADTAILGVASNVDHLRAIVSHPEFLDGNVTTAFLDDHLPDWDGGPVDLSALVAAAVALAPEPGDDVWSSLGPWRIGRSGGWPVRLGDRDTEHQLRITSLPEGARVDVGDARIEVGATSLGDGRYLLAIEGEPVEARVAILGDEVWVHVPGQTRKLALLPATHHADASALSGGASFQAPMPGAVVKVEVAEGDHVDAGQVLVVVEAMKMEHPVTAPSPGTVTAVHVAAGDPVAGGQALIGFEPDDA